MTGKVLMVYKNLIVPQEAMNNFLLVQTKMLSDMVNMLNTICIVWVSMDNKVHLSKDVGFM